MKTRTYFTIKKMALRAITGITLTGLTTNCLSQDTLYTNKGANIASQVLEIKPFEITYKRADNINGPVYTLNKSDISKIKYSNGTVDIFDKQVFAEQKFYPIQKIYGRYSANGQPLNERQLQRLLLNTNDRAITYHIQQAQKDKDLQLVGFAAIPLGIITFLSSDYLTKNNALTAPSAILGAMCIGSSIYFKIDRKKQNAAAARLYNDLNQ